MNNLNVTQYNLTIVYFTTNVIQSRYRSLSIGKMYLEGITVIIIVEHNVFANGFKHYREKKTI